MTPDAAPVPAALTQAAPIQPGERIDVLDAIRGFALLGIFIMNMPVFNTSLFGGYGDPMPNLGGLQVAFGALESLRRNMACELGPHGVRVITLQTGGVPESIPAGTPGLAEVTAAIEGKTMLGRAAGLADVGAVAVFAASDAARSITATSINITCGAVPA